MTRLRARWLLLATGLVAGAAAGAGAETAQVNYLLHCQGCHLAGGSGKPGAVPALGDYVARFARLPEGRRYLVRVPGAALSPLSDAELAEVINLMLERFAPADLTAEVAPFSAAEVAASRRPPLLEVESVRARLLEELDGPAYSE